MNSIPELPQRSFSDGVSPFTTFVERASSPEARPETTLFGINLFQSASPEEGAADVSTTQPLAIFSPLEANSPSGFQAGKFVPPAPIGAADVFAAISIHSSVNGEAKDAVPEQPQKFTKSELCHAAASVAAANNLPIPFFANLIHQESAFKPHAVSSAGAQGIAQFMPDVAVAKGLANPFDPFESLSISGRFLAQLVDRFGNVGLAAAAYNAGSKRVRDWLAKRRQLPAETRHYVRMVTGVPAEVWARKLVKPAAVRLPPHARCPDGTLLAQANEPSKPTLQKSISSPKPWVHVSTITQERPGADTKNVAVVRRSIPQPTQSTTTSSVSRLATMVTSETREEKQRRARPSAKINSSLGSDEASVEPTSNPLVSLLRRITAAQQASGKLNHASKRNVPITTTTAFNIGRPSPLVE